MGGFGSGRPSGSGKAVAEACRSIDVNRLRKENVLREGWSGIWEWKRDGERIASISMRGGREKIVLSYRSRIGQEKWRETNETVPIHWQPCRFGGNRPYFVCPGVVNGQACGRRAIKLFCGGRYYLCRHCYRLSYASRNEDAYDRASRRANKNRMRLGGEPGMSGPIPGRPKGMWRTTYQCLRSEIIECESLAESRLSQLLLRIRELDRRIATTAPKRSKRYWK